MNKSIRRALLPVLTLFVLTTVFVGCAGSGDGKKSGIIFTSDNEITSYEKIDDDKCQLIVAKSGNNNSLILCDMFEEQNPDIQVITYDITGGNENYIPLREWLDAGMTPHVIFSDKLTNLGPEYFTDLSEKAYVNNYHMANLEELDIDGHLYYLPGPSSLTGILYNKTMFEQYGWEVPTTVDEFIELCIQIEKDTNGTVEPWNPNGKYATEFIQTFTSFVYGETLAGAENREWRETYTKSQTGLSGHMEPLFEVIQRFVDNKLIKEEHFAYSATTRGNEFLNGEIAMVNITTDFGLGDTQIEIGVMPFPGLEEDEQYFIRKPMYSIGVPKQEMTSEEEEAVERFMTFISTPEAQEQYIGEQVIFSSVKDVNSDNMPERTRMLMDYIDLGHVYSNVDFNQDAAPDDFIEVELMREIAIKMVTEGLDAKTAIAYFDEQAAKAAEDEKNMPSDEVINVVEEDFTMLETSNYMADMFKSVMDSEIGLVMHNNIFRGNVMLLFKGDITADKITYLKPRSFDNNAKLIKASMTGENLIKALNTPMKNTIELADCIYASSGLKCKVAPTNEIGEKYLEIKLADGSDIDNNKLYTVAFWQGTVSDEYITEILESKEGTFEEIATAYIRADSALKPAKDDRIEIVVE